MMMIKNVYIIGEDDDVDRMGSVPGIMGDEHPVLQRSSLKC